MIYLWNLTCSMFHLNTNSSFKESVLYGEITLIKSKSSAKIKELNPEGLQQCIFKFTSALKGLFKKIRAQSRHQW